MSLLLCCFVLVAAVSEVRKNAKFDQAAQSVRAAFGSRGNPVEMPVETVPTSPLIEQLRSTASPPAAADSEADDGRMGLALNASDVGDGIRLEIIGEALFGHFDAELSPAALDVIQRLAEKLRQRPETLTIKVPGTAGRVPDGCAFADAMDLSYARGRTVADILTGRGLDATRVRVVATGGSELRGPTATNAGRVIGGHRVEIELGE